MGKYGYIGRTNAYYEEIETVFTPNLWDWSAKKEDFEGEVFELTKLGLDLLDEYLEDSSRGYDLCFGRAFGLADRYTREQLWDLLTNDKEFSSPV